VSHALPGQAHVVQKGVVWLAASLQHDQGEQLIGCLPIALALHHRARRARLATSHCDCRAWRATVDHCGLLRAVAGLLPRSVAGILLQLDNTSSSFLSRPSAGPAVSMDLDCTFSSGDGSKVHDDSFEARGHCNGLILLQDGAVSCVANPATRRWAHLPPRPPPPCAGPDYFYADDYLVFDPTVSPYYEVFLIPRVRRRYEPSLVRNQSRCRRCGREQKSPTKNWIPHWRS
jgi:hypothetical protein